MAASDTLVFGVAGSALRVPFWIFDIAGAPVTTWTGKDRYVSFDGAAFGSSTNNIVEVGHGGGYIELTAAETTGVKYIQILPVVTNTDAKPKGITVILGGLAEIVGAVPTAAAIVTTLMATAGDYPADGDDVSALNVGQQWGMAAMDRIVKLTKNSSTGRITMQDLGGNDLCGGPYTEDQNGNATWGPLV